MSRRLASTKSPGPRQCLRRSADSTEASKNGAGVWRRFFCSAHPELTGALELCQQTVQLVQARVADDDAARAAPRSLDAHLRAESVGKLLFESLQITIAFCARRFSPPPSGSARGLC